MAVVKDDPVGRWLDRAGGAFAALGGVCVFALMGVTVVAVFARYGLNDPIFGIEDLSQMGLAVVVACAVAYGARSGAHVSVDIIAMVAGPGVTRITDLLARLLGAGITGYAALALFRKGSCGIACGSITGNLSIVHTPFYYLLGLSMGFYALILVVDALRGTTRGAAEEH